MEHEVDDVAPPPRQVLAVGETHPDGPGHRAGMNQGEPAERDDAQEELRRLARRRVVESELGADGRQRLLTSGEVASPPSRVSLARASRSISRTKLGRAARKSK